MRSKVWLIALSIFGLGLAACDKEDDTALEPSAVNTSAADNNNTGDVVQPVSSHNTQSDAPRAEDQQIRLSGNYQVTYAEYQGQNITASYSGITFRFDDGNIAIDGGGVALKGEYTLMVKALTMYVQGQSGEHTELEKPYWKVAEYDLNRVTIATPFPDAPRYVITLERQM